MLPLSSQESNDGCQGPWSCLPRGRPRHKTKNCRDLLNRQHRKVVLFPEECWATCSANSYLILSPLKWDESTVQIVEVVGGRRGPKVNSKLKETNSGASVVLFGSFKKRPGASKQDFKLFLTTDISREEKRNGYLMTGALHRGSRLTGQFVESHYAAVVDTIHKTL